MLQDQLLLLAQQYGWKLQAWAVFSNHYHFVALSPETPLSLKRFLQHLHSVTAREANWMDDAEGRKVWYQYWDTHITSERSYFARLRYVHENAGRHGIVEVATAYPWCSAGWFEQRADSAFHRMVTSFPIDRVNVHDEFTPEPV